MHYYRESERDIYRKRETQSKREEIVGKCNEYIKRYLFAYT